MKIKIGASYRMRNGGIVTINSVKPRQPAGAPAWLAVAEDGASITYNENGQRRAAWGDIQFDLTGEQVTRVYIAGPMSGIPDLNFPAFNAAAALYRKRGCLVINPAELVPEVSPHLSPVEHWNHCMRVDIAALMTCEMVVALPGWENSKGAQLELRIAADLGMAITWPDVAADPIRACTAEESQYHAILGTHDGSRLTRFVTAEEYRAQYMTQPTVFAQPLGDPPHFGVDLSEIEAQEEKRRARELTGKSLKRRAGE